MDRKYVYVYVLQCSKLFTAVVVIGRSNCQKLNTSKTYFLNLWESCPVA